MEKKTSAESAVDLSLYTRHNKTNGFPTLDMTKENFSTFAFCAEFTFFIHRVANSYIGMLFHSQAAFFQPIDNKV